MIDVFEGEPAGLILCGIEADSAIDLANLAIPEYAVRDVTDDPFFTGGSLCRVSSAALPK